MQLRRKRITALLTSVAVACLLGLSQARATLAAAQIQQLALTLEIFRMDNGTYPTTEEGLDALISPPPRLAGSKGYRAGGYVNGRVLPDDPWGHPYRYRFPGEHNPQEFDIWSQGADGLVGGVGFDADIGNWSGGLEEHKRAAQRASFFIAAPVGAVLGACVGAPIYAVGIFLRKRGGYGWRSALLGRPLAIFVALVLAGILFCIVVLSGVVD